MHDYSQGIMHYVGLRAHRRHIYVLYVHDLPSHPQQITHVWRPYTTFANLTAEEIKNSVTRAQEMNQLATARQAYNDMPVLDKLIEHWLPKRDEPEVPHVIDSKPCVDTIMGFLKEENLT